MSFSTPTDKVKSGCYVLYQEETESLEDCKIAACRRFGNTFNYDSGTGACDILYCGVDILIEDTPSELNHVFILRSKSLYNKYALFSHA